MICEANVLTLCDGDVDYYSLEVSGGSRIEMELSDYGGDLDLAIYGPFDSFADAQTDALLLEDATNGPTKIVSATARVDGFFIARVLRDQGERTGYAVNVVVDTPPSACVEDSLDADGLNDSFAQASLVTLNPTGTTNVPLNVCIADTEWLNLTLDGSNPIPPGYRVSAAIEQGVGSPNALSLALLSTETSVLSGSNDVNAPSAQASIGLTDGSPLYAQILSGPDNPSHESVELVFTLEAPPACNTSAHDAPASAIALNPTSWSEAGDSETAYAGEPLCGQEDDWYVVSVPAGLQLVATVEYDPTDVEVAFNPR